MSCFSLGSALESNPSHLTELDLSQNNLSGSSVKKLCGFLKRRDCRLKVLRLMSCSLSEKSCYYLISALNSNLAHLTELDLSQNNLCRSGVEKLCRFLGRSDCRLKVLRLWSCNLSEISCYYLGSALESNPSHLTELDLSQNNLSDLGVKELFRFLESPDCRLEVLRLRSCSLSEISCSTLDSALKLNPFRLTVTTYSWDGVSSEVQVHTSVWASPNCGQELQRWRESRLSETGCCSLGSALKSNPFHLTELDLSRNNLSDSGVKDLCGFLESPDCRLKVVRLKSCSLSEISCSSLVSALKSNPSHLTELDLSQNNLSGSGLNELCGFLESPDCRLEVLRLENCGLSETSCSSLGSALKSNPSHLTELDLSQNNLKAPDVKQLLDLVESPDYKLQTLRWES